MSTGVIPFRNLIDMGIWRKPMSFKFSDAERADLQRIHDALAPMHETLSQTIRWSVRIVHLLIFTKGMLPKLAAMIQGLQGSEVYDIPSLAAPEPGLMELRRPFFLHAHVESRGKGRRQAQQVAR